jgi:hypothetical protein
LKPFDAALPMDLFSRCLPGDPHLVQHDHTALSVVFKLSRRHQNVKKSMMQRPLFPPQLFMQQMMM